MQFLTWGAGNYQMCAPSCSYKILFVACSYKILQTGGYKRLKSYSVFLLFVCLFVFVVLCFVLFYS